MLLAAGKFFPISKYSCNQLSECVISVVSELCGIKFLLTCCCSSTTMRTKLFSIRCGAHIKSSNVTISVAIGKGLNPAPLLKMTVLTFMVKKKVK